MHNNDVMCGIIYHNDHKAGTSSSKFGFIVRGKNIDKSLKKRKHFDDHFLNQKKIKIHINFYLYGVRQKCSQPVTLGMEL